MEAGAPFRLQASSDRISWMDFVTIHQLSREFDLPARVVRYRLLSLLQAQKLHEGEDFRREDYKDERHFVWKVNPLSFMRESGLKPKTLPSDPLPIVNDPLTAFDPPVNESPAFVNTPPATYDEIDNKTETDDFRANLEREMIDFLKDQIAVKDRQLSEQATQSKEIHEVNVKLIGATLQQSKRIEELLRLVGKGRPAAEESVNDPLSTVNHVHDGGEETVNESSEEEQRTA